MTAVGDVAPDASLPMLGGGTLRLRDAFDRGVVLLAFFRLDCGASKIAIPQLPRLRVDGLTAWGVSQDPPEPTATWLSSEAPALGCLVDHEPWPASRAYGVDAVPMLVLVARGGTVVEVTTGWDAEAFVRTGARAASAVGVPYRPPDLSGVPAFRPG